VVYTEAFGPAANVITISFSPGATA
jgi:hypothetical protein